MTHLLNKHAPLKSEVVKIVPNAPWFDFENENVRRLCRKAQSQYKRTGLDAHKDNYKNPNLAFEKKRIYYSERLRNSSNPSKSLYSVTNKLLDKKQETILPETTNDLELADSFINYFTNKIDKIRSRFVMAPSDDTSIVVPNSQLSSFQRVTVDDIHQTVLSYGIKCSPEDLNFRFSQKLY